MTELSASSQRALARLKELHREEEAPADFRVLVSERLARLEAPAPRSAFSRRGGVGLLLLAAAAAVALGVRSDRTQVSVLPEHWPTTAPPSHSGELKAGRIAVSGALPPDVIRAVMRDEFGRFRECYQTLPQPRPVVVSKLNFTIGAAGTVTTGHVDSEASPALGQCLERVMLAIRFPAPQAGDVTVAYPMQFRP
jgi:hypothetical protein